MIFKENLFKLIKKNFFESIAILCVILVILTSWYGELDNQSNAYINDAIAQAGAVFALDKTLDSVISVIQGTNFSLGVASWNVGAFLDPIDGLVEDFGTVIQWVFASLLLQKILIEITSHVFFNYLLLASGLLIVISFLTGYSSLKSGAIKLFMTLTIMRFSLFLVLVFHNQIEENFIKKDIESEVKYASIVTGELEKSTQNGNGFSDKENQYFNDELLVLNNNISDFTINLGNQKEKIKVEVNALSNINIKINDQKKNISLIDSFKSKDASLTTLEKQAKQLEFSIDELEKLIKKSNKDIENLMRQRDKVQLKLAGKSDGMIDDLQHKFKSISSKVPDLAAFKEKVETLADHIIRMIALFAIKDILLPLIFIYLLFVMNRMVWRLSFVEWMDNGILSNLEKNKKEVLL